MASLDADSGTAVGRVRDVRAPRSQVVALARVLGNRRAWLKPPLRPSYIDHILSLEPSRCSDVGILIFGWVFGSEPRSSAVRSKHRSQGSLLQRLVFSA